MNDGTLELIAITVKPLPATPACLPKPQSDDPPPKNLSSFIGMTDVPSDPAHLVLADWSTLLKNFQLYLNNICQLRLSGVDKNKQRFNGFIFNGRNCKTFERLIKEIRHIVRCRI
jgi:hypothetical protein